MGLLRFLLAMLVMLSHTGLTVGGLNPGVVAVVVFYAISGYVMSALIGKHFSQTGQAVHFYIDRLARIYPQYLFYAVAAGVWFFWVGQTTHFLQHPPSWLELLNNVLIVPLNFFMFNAADQFTLVPPAWSLGAEVLFYVLAPWLWRHWRVAVLVGAGSLVVQALAWHNLLSTDAWGYRLLPGVLWIFIAGMALQRYQQSHTTLARHAVWLVPLLSLAAAFFLAQQDELSRPYNREVLLGFALALPAIAILTWRSPPSGVWQAMDKRLGDWSYGIFLNHFACMWVLGLTAPQNPQQWALLSLASIGMSALTQQYLERPSIIWRQKRRQAWQLAHKALKIQE
jgi:peptidoglycan/LPS O-acetylase OafA/YrhL